MDCNNTMDWLDNAKKTELENITDAEIKRHIESCESCGKYYRVSVALSKMDAPVPEMWGAFEEKLSGFRNANRVWGIRYALISIAASLVVAVGLIFNPWTSPEKSVKSYPYSDQLEYVAELSEGRNYLQSGNDPLECYYTLSINY